MIHFRFSPDVQGESIRITNPATDYGDHGLKSIFLFLKFPALPHRPKCKYRNNGENKPQLVYHGNLRKQHSQKIAREESARP